MVHAIRRSTPGSRAFVSLFLLARFAVLRQRLDAGPGRPDHRRRGHLSGGAPRSSASSISLAVGALRPGAREAGVVACVGRHWCRSASRGSGEHSDHGRVLHQDASGTTSAAPRESWRSSNREPSSQAGESKSCIRGSRCTPLRSQSRATSCHWALGSAAIGSHMSREEYSPVYRALRAAPGLRPARTPADRRNGHLLADGAGGDRSHRLPRRACSFFALLLRDRLAGRRCRAGHR